jgi:hypothetical protein
MTEMEVKQFVPIMPPAGKRWFTFECVDTPTNAEDDTPCGYKYIAPLPEDAPYDAGGPIEFCPACGGYLSFVGAPEGHDIGWLWTRQVPVEEVVKRITGEAS